MGLRDKARKTLEEGDAVVAEPVETPEPPPKAVAEPADVPAPPPKEAPAETVAKDALRHELQRARTALAAREEAWAKAEGTVKGKEQRFEAVAQELNAAKGVVKAKEEEALRVERELTAAKSDLTAARQAVEAKDRDLQAPVGRSEAGAWG